jgi:hypothetical protein
MEFQEKCSVASVRIFGRHSVYDLLEYSSQDNSVGIVAGYRLDDKGIRVPFQTEARDFLFRTASRLELGPTRPPIQWVLWGFFPRGNAAWV